jgi:hypothetical protein
VGTEIESGDGEVAAAFVVDDELGDGTAAAANAAVANAAAAAAAAAATMPHRTECTDKHFVVPHAVGVDVDGAKHVTADDDAVSVHHRHRQRLAIVADAVVIGGGGGGGGAAAATAAALAVDDAVAVVSSDKSNKQMTPVNHKVQKLISVATNKAKLSQMAATWNPWW